MAVNKINGIAYSSIAKINGKTTAQLTKFNGQALSASTPPPSGPSRVVACFDDAYVSWADIGEDTDADVPKR